LPDFGNIFYEATLRIRFLLSVTFIYEATGGNNTQKKAVGYCLLHFVPTASGFNLPIPLRYAFVIEVSQIFSAKDVH
ncbi:MAG: hypothetical protein JW976_06315, partial [Syntrophaceae bacterium]|nr:hypothetical protein [Syntrophaceae bacterium]